MTPALPELDAASFDALTAGGKPVLAEFFGPGCIICRQLEPMLGAVARETAGRLAVVRVDASTNPALADRLAIRNLPTLILYQDGTPQARRSGFMTAGELRRWIGPALAEA